MSYCGFIALSASANPRVLSHGPAASPLALAAVSILRFSAAVTSTVMYFSRLRDAGLVRRLVSALMGDNMTTK